MEMAIRLILINAFLLLWIGYIRQENPFDIWVLCLLPIGNGIFSVAAAILLHEEPLIALSCLVTNLLPVFFFVLVVALLLWVMAIGTHKKDVSS